MTTRVTTTKHTKACDLDIQVVHVSQEGPDSYESTTIVLDPYTNAVDLHIGHTTVEIPEHAIPEVIAMLRRYRHQLAAMERARKRKLEETKTKS